MKKLLTGNEAIARGAWEAGVVVCTAYPGTPSTEITENAAKYNEIYSEWSPNEKVALEVGLGASIAGGRTLVAMKHVGVNVAADPLFTLAYTGINGGLVLVSADDPGMHSSQNEQDNRHLGRAAKIPIFEPSDSQEAKDFTKLALEISEQFDTPVMLRITTRIAHSQSLVEFNDREEKGLKEYKKNPHKYVMIPAYARQRHLDLEKRLLALKEYSDSCPLNRVEWHETKIGIITSGVAYQYVRETLPSASVLKIGMSYPLPEKMIRDFAQKVDELYVIEELDPFIEDQMKAWGIKTHGKDIFSNIGEILPEIINEKMLKHTPALVTQDIPVRPPVLCPGCPHRALFYMLKKLNLTVTGDIGCYTLGSLPPLNAMDTTICMGASIGAAIGMEKARGKDFARNLVAVIGDSTFIHSGITGLIDVVYNKATTTTIILDNRTTGMTGHQDNPANGCTIKKEANKEVNLELLAKAVGVERVAIVDPFNLAELEQIMKAELAAEEPSVIIVKRKCVLIEKSKGTSCFVTSDCVGCMQCLKLGCPCIVKENKRVVINSTQCVGCGLCQTVCTRHAIKKEGVQ
ncbi:indolepyruvate ferredoxin oxidoreductase, alpha subunit [Syntrophobotulus glycolicus DSM 8271]|uniref:Indolepyruvate oxidoreductase subunit IorA n=1 Tax=Syntrophobotulus glycolicus (strain DSM 8271 / FlGlyR) TaxID=645991 RepID=F0SW66_SYNGF|nr:indolepyruvate ferredoxin oxidoreductase subunit alpha [Syntrophobotulus glycolicus]ADY54552.1 indolepyruvate ferredoxin oxidoreductase, alpha subunit [Syntrophobotulus glycolicus DSM 8271]